MNPIGIQSLDLTDLTQTCCECDACGRRRQFMQLRVHWFQVLLFPVVPLGLKGAMKCLHCGAAPRPSQLSAEAQQYGKSQRRLAISRGPLLLLTGSSLFTGLFIWAVVQTLAG